MIAFNSFRKINKLSMMRSALAGRIILHLKNLRNPFILLCFVCLVGTVSSYFLLNLLGFAIIPLYREWLATSFVVVCSNNLNVKNKGKTNNFEKLKDHVENLGGSGPKVAAYLRVSSIKQAKDGYSLEAQYDELSKLRNTRTPSRIFWFIDPGKTGSKNFDRRKMNTILRLRERGEVQELWVMNVSRMGRECRRLLYFFLDFCDNGAKIVTPKNEYSLTDLASMILYFLDAHSAEKTTKERTEASVAGKRTAFKKKRWNKPVPIGYVKRIWLEKRIEFEPLIKFAHEFFAKTRCIETVRNRLNIKFSYLLPNLLSRSRVKRILSDPVIIGKPEHSGTVVIDPTLAFIDYKIFERSLKILEKIHNRYKPARIGPLEQLATSSPITFLETVKIFELHHRGCGGLVVKNGTTKDEGEWQQLLKCKSCPAEWRLPHIRSLNRFQGTPKEESMGWLVFDYERPNFKSSISKKKMRHPVRTQPTKTLLSFI